MEKPEHKRHLDIQQLDSAANSLRVQLQKGRQAVAALPDMDRTVEEQEEEIEWLEDRIRRMNQMLNDTRNGLRADAARSTERPKTEE